VQRPPTIENPLLHAGRALFAASTGDEAGVELALRSLLAHDRDGRHRRWAVDELVFAPFRGCTWFASLFAPPVAVARSPSGTPRL
jgi:GAF domain-containing protein